MFDQLVESSSHVKEDTRRGGLLLSTLLIVASIFVGGIIYSIFANDVFVGGDELELSTLVAPVPVPEEAPPPPEPEQPKEQKQVTQEKVDTQVPMRTDNIARVDETVAVPDKIQTGPSNVKARPNTAFVLGDKNVDPVGAPGPVSRGDSSGGGTPVAIAPKPQVVENDDDPPPPVKTPTPKPTPPPVPKTVSGGVVNGKAVNLVKPPYPPAARAVRAAGTVNVQVTIDENGNVISANAVSGHALLRSAAESAARSSKFSPTTLSGQKVKVTGVIVYNFAAQ